MKRLFYKLNRAFIRLVAKPSASGTLIQIQGRQQVYVIHHRSLTDLIVLDLVAEQHDLPSPLEPITDIGVDERSRFLPLMRAASGRITMQTMSARLSRLMITPDQFKAQTDLIPVSIFWGRALSGDGSWLKVLTSENWAASGRFKRVLNLFLNRRNIVVHFGKPLSLAEAASTEDPGIALRRTARYLRVRLRRQRIRTLGPDFSHRRRLVDQIVNSHSVKAAISAQSLRSGEGEDKLEKRAHAYARTISSDMAHPTVRVLARFLSWFWQRIYDDVVIHGLDNIEELALTHTLVYAPSHRSHLDYLLLSYLLYYKNFMIPHIASGDNLNLPILGSILRRGGAFFMRRSFREDPLYAAVFEEYLYYVYQVGHSVEFFPEGGRSRTGRLLQAKHGFLRMTLAAQKRGLKQPLAVVPVYIGYEKLVEGTSYLSELRGASKQKESLSDLFHNIKLIKQNFGSVRVNIGVPVHLDVWLEQHTHETTDTQVRKLGRQIMQGINGAAHLNPINLVSLVTLATPRLAIEAALLERQIDIYRQLIYASGSSSLTTTSLDTGEILEHAKSLNLLDYEAHEFGSVLSLDPLTAVLMTWYRNNVVHTLAYPSLIACLLIRRRRAISTSQLKGLVDRVFPYIADELSCPVTASFNGTVHALMQVDLISDGEFGISAPAQDSPQHRQLALLANLVMPTLERMYIVISLLEANRLKKSELRRGAHALAQKISRLYGINAPEFADERLFDQFIAGLLEADLVRKCEDDVLSGSGELRGVLRAAETVIEPQIRQGVASHDK